MKLNKLIHFFIIFAFLGANSLPLNSFAPTPSWCLAPKSDYSNQKSESNYTPTAQDKKRVSKKELDRFEKEVQKAFWQEKYRAALKGAIKYVMEDSSAPPDFLRAISIISKISDPTNIRFPSQKQKDSIDRILQTNKPLNKIFKVKETLINELLAKIRFLVSQKEIPFFKVLPRHFLNIVKEELLKAIRSRNFRWIARLNKSFLRSVYFFILVKAASRIEEDLAPKFMLENFLSRLYKFIFDKLAPELRKYYEKEDMDQIRQSLDFTYPLVTGDEATPFSAWMEKLLVQNPTFYQVMKRVLMAEAETEEKKHQILDTIFAHGYSPFESDSLNEQEQLAISKRILEELNKGTLSEGELKAVALYYKAFVSPFPRRINLIQNPQTDFALYSLLLDHYLSAAEQYRIGTDHEFKFKTVAEAASDERRNAKEKLDEYFTYNPSKELLRQAIRLLSQKQSPGAPIYKRKKTALPPGTKIPLLNDREINALGWIINNSPKNDQTRDQRRRCHRFVLDLVERRFQREEDPVSQVMSALLVEMKTNEPDRQKNVATVLAFFDFALLFSSLTRSVQNKTQKQMETKLESWRRPEKGKEAQKLFLTADHYKELKEIVTEQLVKSFFGEGTSFSEQELALLKKSIREHTDAWYHDGFLPLLARYHGFQNDAGKEAVRKFLMNLANAEVRGNRFVQLPRYDWEDPQIKAWFGNPLIQKFQKGIDQPVSEEMNGVSLKDRFHDIWSDIIVHLGISDTASSEQCRILLETWKEKRKNADQFDKFWETFTQIQMELALGEIIPKEKIKEWREALKKLEIQKIFPGGGEVLINLDQIEIVQKLDPKSIGKMQFVISEDPVAFIRSGEMPYYTCQRCVEPTGVNQNGCPINRARQGHFLLAQIVSSSGEVLSRAILEIAKVKEPDKNPREWRKALLVERIYQKGYVSSKLFQKRILEWAAQDKAIDFVVFASGGGEPKALEKIEIELLPSDGEIYRDTNWSTKLQAVNMRKYQALPTQALLPTEHKTVLSHRSIPQGRKQHATPLPNSTKVEISL